MKCFSRRGVPMEAKPFQLGVRIEQPQAAIDGVRYGPSAGHPALGAADYSASVRTGSRDLFTFCMCAGGYVMPSVSDPGYFCTNGMSESRHDSPFANSGLVVTIDPEETGSSHPLAGIHYQQRVERLAYVAGGESYKAPIQWARDFLAGRPSRGKIPSSYRRGTLTVELAPLLPEAVVESLLIGLPAMDRRFGRRFLRDATLTGPESRGSSPVRITRDLQSRQSPAVAGLYPCGEGAGYAGGIVERGRRWRADGAGDCGNLCEPCVGQRPRVVVGMIQISERTKPGIDGPHLRLVGNPRLDGVD